MATGREISVSFIRESVWPTLQREMPGECERLAIAVIGTGSDVMGLDDEISRDHHWGPRANVLVLPEDEETLIPRVRRVLESKMPSEFRGFPVDKGLVIMTGLCCYGIDEFFSYFLGQTELPESAPEWLRLCEVDLFHVTSGEVVIDGPGELSRRREWLSYYPDDIWKKRLADWCIYLTGRDAPYNLNRAARRGDTLTGSIYKAMFCKQAMEMCFMLNRRYAPYTKWLNHTYRLLPRYVDEIAPRLDALASNDDHRQNVHQMIEINYLIGDALADLGLAPAPKHREFDEGLTDLALYDSAWELYKDLPTEFRYAAFNRTEMWEKLVRDAMFDARDAYQQMRSAESE